MSAPPLPPEPLADRAPSFPAADGPPDPVIYDGSARALRQRTVTFAAKRLTDMIYVTGLDQARAERHLRWRAAAIPGGLAARPVPDAGVAAALEAARRDGRLAIVADDRDKRVTVRWTDPDFGPPVAGSALARPGYGGIVLGAEAAPRFDPKPIARAPGTPDRDWPFGDAVAPPPRPRSPPAPRVCTACWPPRPSASCSSATATSAGPTVRRRVGR